jgi:basic amino acid/polyamine antiporter, APA family
MGTPREHQRQLGWADCAGLIVGIMLGTGIFAVFPKLAAEHAPSTLLITAAWLAGTVIALCGAFCFAELAALFPREGGEYVFLKEAFGKNGNSPVSFLFAWAQIFVIRPASLVSLAIVLSVNAVVIVRPLIPAQNFPVVEKVLHYFFTLGTLLFFTTATLTGVRASRKVQNAFTLLKLACLGTMIGLGLYLGRDKAANLAPVMLPEGMGWTGVLKGLGVALIPVMWVFGGWNEAPYIAAEMKDPARNIPKALVVALLGLGLLYTLTNFVYVLHLTPAGLASSWTFASDLMREWFGTGGEMVMAAVLVVSTAGAVNGLTVTGARMTHAFAEDMGLIRLESGEPPSYLGALAVNLAIAAGLTLVMDCEPESIDRMLAFTAGVVWLFSALVAGAVFVFRAHPPPGGLPYKSPFFPWTPLVFILMCGYMLYGAWEYRPLETSCGIGALLAGVPVYLLGHRAVESSRRGRVNAP